MNDEEDNRKTTIGEMRKRREKMADGKRYIIYYTFEQPKETPEDTAQNEVKENV
jgi:hypothetical protein